MTEPVEVIPSSVIRGHRLTIRLALVALLLCLVFMWVTWNLMLENGLLKREFDSYAGMVCMGHFDHPVDWPTFSIVKR